MLEPIRPRCYNRPETRKGYWIPVRSKKQKLTFRFVYHRMTIDCGAWKTMGGLDDVDPIRFKWNCSGCRWHPDVLGVPMLYHDFTTGGYSDKAR